MELRELTRSQARDQLASWAAVDRRRDLYVLEARAAGLSKQEIHAITGIRPATILAIERRHLP